MSDCIYHRHTDRCRPPIQCPFCKETDFDLIGLKHHYESGYCEEFNKTLTIEEEREQRRYEQDKKQSTYTTEGLEI